MRESISERSREELNLADALFVFALDVEATNEFEHLHTIFTGCGKVNAAYALAKALQQRRPNLIVNLGSAGSRDFKKGEVICCTRFLQRDMNATALGFAPYQTPFANTDAVLPYGQKLRGLPEGVCGSGDSFETAHTTPDYNVVDMEAYALAYVAQQEGLPFLCLKYISDGADGAAAEEWTVQVHRAAAAFKQILFPEQ